MTTRDETLSTIRRSLGVTGADCGMLLFADAEARVIGACHAGWKGALTGMIDATVSTEDANFWNSGGVDVRRMCRSASRSAVAGATTRT